MNNNAPIVQVDMSLLAPGSLADLFTTGALAVIVDCASTLHPIWSALIENKAEQLPWHGTMRDMARNHYAGADLGEHVGDMFHYTPYRIAYIARKFELMRDVSTSQLVTVPEYFFQGNERFSSPTPIFEACWTIVQNIMKWLTPPGSAASSFHAVVHRLKYEPDIQLTERHYALAKSAVGRWAQLGYEIDTLREQARGPLDHTGVSDMCAILSLVAPMRRLLDRVNTSFARSDARRALPEGARLIGKPHYDGRYFSATCGSRGHISTEIYDGKHWHELPVDRDHLVIVPGLQAKKAFGLSPTLHRIIHRSDYVECSGDQSHAPDITLLFGSKSSC
ncbi:MAG TPA: hypothetical protein VIP51_15415 [Eoetvoesiella sp.]